MNINIVMKKNGLRGLEMQRPQLKYFKCHPDAPSLRFATQGSACFDIAASWAKDKEIYLGSLGNTCQKEITCPKK